MKISSNSVRIACANRGIPAPSKEHRIKVAAVMHPVRKQLIQHKPGPQGTTVTVGDALRKG